MARFDIISLTPSSGVAKDATMVFTYPSGNASRYAKSGEKLIISGLQNVVSQGASTFTLVYGASSVTVTYKGETTIPAGTEVKLQLPLFPKVGIVQADFFVNLVAVTGAQDIVTDYTPGFAFRILSLDWVQANPVTTASRLASLNAEIGTTDVTGGVIALTSALATPMGKIINGSAISGNNVGTATDKISIEASAVTAFAEGSGTILLTLQNLDLLNEFDDRAES